MENKILYFNQKVDKKNRIYLPPRVIQMIDPHIFTENLGEEFNLLLDPIDRRVAGRDRVLFISQDVPFCFYKDYSDKFQNSFKSWRVYSEEGTKDIIDLGAVKCYEGEERKYLENTAIITFSTKIQLTKSAKRVSLHCDTNDKMNYAGTSALLICKKKYCDIVTFLEEKDRDDAYQKIRAK